METFGVDFLRHDIQALEDYHKSLTDEQLLGPTLRCRFRVALPKNDGTSEIREYDPVTVMNALFNDPEIDYVHAIQIAKEIPGSYDVFGVDYVHEQMESLFTLFSRVYGIPKLTPSEQNGLTFEEFSKLNTAFTLFVDRFKKKLPLWPILPRDSVTRGLLRGVNSKGLNGSNSSITSTERESIPLDHSQQALP